METGTIEHQGVITGFDNKIIKVSLLNVSSCASCHAKAMCSVSDVDQKEIEVLRKGQAFNIGEKVRLSYQKSLGFKALFLGYLFPFLLVVSTLIISMTVTGDEPLSGLLSLAILVPYYFSLTFFRDRLNKTFTFTVVR